MSFLKVAPFTVLTLVLGAVVAAAQEQPPAPTMPLKVMTFNLRYASDVRPNSWPERRPVMSACLQSEATDIIGTQEGGFEQLKDMMADQPVYGCIGLGRNGGSHGETVSILYRTARLDPVEYDHFWLSETPEVIGSQTWGSAYKRMVTWVRFRDRQSGQQFYYWNTHFDNKSQEAREKSAQLILQRVKGLGTDLPIIMGGDFNAWTREDRTYGILTGPDAFQDTWFSAAKRSGQNFATFHGYQAPVPDGTHIDWILTRGAVTVQDTRVVPFAQNGQYPSDHFPVVATIEFPTNTPKPLALH